MVKQPSRSHEHLDEDRELESLVWRWGRRLAIAVLVPVMLHSCRYRHAPVDTILDTDIEFIAGSRIEFDSLSEAELENLVVLAKVWGFLKYHHPRVTGGQLHWDFELFRVLPSVLTATDATERNAVLLGWVQGLGEVPNCAECASAPSDARLQPRIDWIRDEQLLGEQLSLALRDVWVNRPTGEQFWVGQHAAGNPDFSREPAYAQLEHVDAGYRILAVFRLWNIVEYWFPYRDLIDENWDEVLRELLPTFVEAHKRDDYERALLGLIARVHDTHANIWTALDSRPPIGACTLEAGVRFIDGQAVVTGGMRIEPELREGDVLLALDGVAVEDSIAAWRPYYAASNDAARLREIARYLTRGECGTVVVTVDRDGQQLQLNLNRRTSSEHWLRYSQGAHDRYGDTLQLFGDDVAYIKLSSIWADDVRRHIEDAAGTRGLIIDIRGYPHEFVVFELGQHLVDSPTPFARATLLDLSNPGAFTWTNNFELLPHAPRYMGKIVILVDEASLSQAEYTAMAFRAAPEAIVIGSTTAGADGNVSKFSLPGGEEAAISGIGVFYPDKRPTQRVGIVPDISVGPTREGIRDRRDEVLERALREILGPQVPDTKIHDLAGG